MQYRTFKSASGDWFAVPADQFDAETKAYRAAVARGDEPEMLRFEEGRTGWQYCKSRSAAFHFRPAASE